MEMTVGTSVNRLSPVMTPVGSSSFGRPPGTVPSTLTP